jgi:hypothetical protein
LAIVTTANVIYSGSAGPKLGDQGQFAFSSTTAESGDFENAKFRGFSGFMPFLSMVYPDTHENECKCKSPQFGESASSGNCLFASLRGISGACRTGFYKAAAWNPA